MGEEFIPLIIRSGEGVKELPLLYIDEGRYSWDPDTVSRYWSSLQLTFHPNDLVGALERERRKLWKLFEPDVGDFAPVLHKVERSLHFATRRAYEILTKDLEWKRDPGDENWEPNPDAHFGPDGAFLQLRRDRSLEKLVGDYRHEAGHAMDGSYNRRDATMAEVVAIATERELGTRDTHYDGPHKRAQTLLDEIERTSVYCALSFREKRGLFDGVYSHKRSFRKVRKRLRAAESEMLGRFKGEICRLDNRTPKLPIPDGGDPELSELRARSEKDLPARGNFLGAMLRCAPNTFSKTWIPLQMMISGGDVELYATRMNSDSPYQFYACIVSPNGSGTQVVGEGYFTNEDSRMDSNLWCFERRFAGLERMEGIRSLSRSKGIRTPIRYECH